MKSSSNASNRGLMLVGQERAIVNEVTNKTELIELLDGFSN